MEYLQELTASVKNKECFVLFCFYIWDFFFKLINIEEKQKKRDCYIVLFDYFPTCIFV